MKMKNHYSPTIGKTIQIPEDAIGVEIYHNGELEAVEKADGVVLSSMVISRQPNFMSVLRRKNDDKISLAGFTNGKNIRVDHEEAGISVLQALTASFVITTVVTLSLVALAALVSLVLN